MTALTERRDSLIKECESLQGQFKEAATARQKADSACQELTAQFNDRQSRINELNLLIKEETTEEENPEACPA
jgi:chromosome segregation ATPase